MSQENFTEGQILRATKLARIEQIQATNRSLEMEEEMKNSSNQSRDLAGEANGTLRAAETDGVAGQPGFTPGPWRITVENSIRYVRSSDNRIAATAHSMLNGIDNAAKELEADANASLIAAAPALYEALRGWNDWSSGSPCLVRVSSVDRSCLEFHKAFAEQCRNCRTRTALALATTQVTSSSVADGTAE